jgi:putative transposase
MIHHQHHAEFFTATNLNWLPILQNDFHKQILIEAIKHRVDNGEIIVYGFVIMPNHFHIIWRINGSSKKADFQRDFMKFTARSILKFMLMNDDPLLQSLQVKAADRQQQVWERNSLGIDLYTEAVFLQKLKYIHDNPMQPKWQLCNLPQEYFYSSARFYETGGQHNFGFLTHFRD